jgi:hypothetical protein
LQAPRFCPRVVFLFAALHVRVARGCKMVWTPMWSRETERREEKRSSGGVAWWRVWR